ncbi:hypothetical protein GCM10011583_70150 [Streptomyces camponoticapitis]|uniref:Uncharacterized protein n=1 Tax=Streptomyces camponoticapitis TaxID=1616125 RepID=A0ABQ2EVD8_9ACTN|nr:hypothetical protein GCM10011583_70150 [Streptomyces camponoticapitis]
MHRAAWVFHGECANHTKKYRLNGTSYVAVGRTRKAGPRHPTLVELRLHGRAPRRPARPGRVRAVPDPITDIRDLCRGRFSSKEVRARKAVRRLHRGSATKATEYLAARAVEALASPVDPRKSGSPVQLVGADGGGSGEGAAGFEVELGAVDEPREDAGAFALDEFLGQVVDLA